MTDNDNDDEIELLDFDEVNWSGVNVSEARGALLACNDARCVANMRSTARSVASAKIADSLLAAAFLIASVIGILSPLTALFMLVMTLIFTTIVSRFIVQMLSERLEEARTAFAERIHELAEQHPRIN